MFDELEIYSKNDHFFFSPDQNLEKVCNAPKDSSGVYIVYALANDKVELIYIGSSGKIINDGTIKHRLGGLFDRIVNGKQFEYPRRISWPSIMEEENIEALDIYWYVTFNNEVTDIPTFVESLIMQKFFDIHECLPRWNKEY